MLPSRHAACERCAGVPTSRPGCPVLFEKGEQRRACQRKHQRPITDAPTHHAFLQEGEGVLPEAWKQQVPLYPELERLVDELLRWGEAGLGGWLDRPGLAACPGDSVARATSAHRLRGGLDC